MLPFLSANFYFVRMQFLPSCNWQPKKKKVLWVKYGFCRTFSLLVESVVYLSARGAGTRLEIFQVGVNRICFPSYAPEI